MTRRNASRTPRATIVTPSVEPAQAVPSRVRLEDLGRIEPTDLPPARAPAVPIRTELFVWFEDQRGRVKMGSVGFPECLLPIGDGIRVLERHFVAGHPHMLAAVRLRCDRRFGERVAEIYTSALAIGTIAWIGTGEQYRRAWSQMYPQDTSA